MPLRPDTEYEVSLEASCPQEADVTLNLIGMLEGSKLTDEDSDGIYSGMIRMRSDFVPGEAMLDIICGNRYAAYIGETEKHLGSTVSDVETGAPLAGAKVTVYQGHTAVDGADFLAWQLWQADEYGQENPVMTDGNGRFNIGMPPGIYRFVIEIEGYQPFTSRPTQLFGVFPSRNIRLTPVQSGSPNHVVGLTEDGVSTPILNVQAGDVVEWQNVDIANHAVSNAAWDSGLLGSTDKFQMRFNMPGVYSYGDSEDPSSQGVIIVTERGQYSLFLPVIQRQ